MRVFPSLGETHEYQEGYLDGSRGNPRQYSENAALQGGRRYNAGYDDAIAGRPSQ